MGYRYTLEKGNKKYLCSDCKDKRIMGSVLEKKVSVYKNYYTPEKSKDVPLIDILTLNHEKLINLIGQIRAEPIKEKRDQLKAKLFCFTPSGVFSSRSESGLIRHSSFLQFDIDFKDNQHIKNYDSLKDQICNIQNVAYCGLSASGQGYWGLVPIAYPEKHKEHFDALQQDFERFGIIIDEKPKNVSSLRGYSYDPEGYFNHQAKVYKKVFLPKKREQQYFTPSATPAACNQNQTRDRVEKLIELIIQSGIDITGSYQTWFEIGCSLANEFGEDGREYFHLISQYHPDYRESTTDKQFSHCLKHNYQYQINTFFHYCKLHGVRTQEIGLGCVAINESSTKILAADIYKPIPERINHSESYLAEMVAGCPF